MATDPGAFRIPTGVIDYNNRPNGAQLKAILLQAGWAPANIPTAIAIIEAESSGVVNKKSGTNKDGSHDWGLFQINDKANADVLKTGRWDNALDNAKMGLIVYNRQGWKAWTTYNDGAYLKHMTDVNTGMGSNDTGGVSAAGGIADALGIRNPLDALGSTLTKIGLDIITVLVILVLFVVGVVLLLHSPIGKAVKFATGTTPSGHAQKIVRSTL